jgi:hypothetical protein
MGASNANLIYIHQVEFLCERSLQNTQANISMYMYNQSKEKLQTFWLVYLRAGSNLACV